MSSSMNAETIYNLKTEEDLPIAEVSFTGTVPLAVVADSIETGRSLSVEELRMMQMLIEGGLATEEPAFELKPVCIKDKEHCLRCKCFCTLQTITLPDGSQDLELYLCPQAGVKVKDNIKLSYLATMSPKAQERLEAWMTQRQEEGQAKAAAKEEAADGN